MQKLAVVVAAARVVQVAVVLVPKLVVVAEVTALVLPNQPGVAQQQLRLLRLPSQWLAQGLEESGIRPQVR
jgi:hypothetical protein